MAGLRFTDLQSRPMEFLDFTSLTLDEFQQLVPPFETAFHARIAAWRVGGRRGARGRPSGGGARPCGAHPSRRAGLPPFAHDGTERRIVRPQDPAEQKESYSGKKKDHTVKNVLLVNALLIILFLSDTYGGRTHDKPIADATPYPLPAGDRKSTRLNSS